MRHEQQAEARRLLELELEQARYEASLAERRYAACDPDNRLIAVELEKSWESALGRVRACEARVASHSPPTPDSIATAATISSTGHSRSWAVSCARST